MKNRNQWELGYGSVKSRNTLFLIQKLSLAVFCLSCLCWSPWQQQPSRSLLLLLAPMQMNSTRGQKQHGFQGSKKMCCLPSFPLPATFAIVFFSLLGTRMGANLSHLFFFRTQQKQMCFLFSRLSRQPDWPYCVWVGMLRTQICQQKARLG